MDLSMSNSPYYNYLQLWSHIKAPHRKRFFLLSILMILASIVEVVSIGAVIPFLSALTTPQQVFDHQLAQPLIALFDIINPQQFLLLLTILFSIAAVVSGMVRIALLWAQTRFSHAIGADLSESIYRRTLFQPYEVHIARNSSEVISGISIKSSQVVTNILMPTFTIISSMLILALILVLLVIMNPVIAISTTGLFGLFYAFIIFFVKKRLMINGEIMSHKQNDVIKSLQEGLGGIRDVLLDGVQNVYCNIFHHSDLVLRKAQADNQIIGGSPRFVIESISIVLIAFLAFFLVNEKGGIEFAIPILGALALSAQRALPLLQQIFQSWSSIRGSQSILQDILSFLNQKIPSHACLNLKERLVFENSISLTRIGYKYNSAAPWIFKNLNLNIKKGSCIGFIGTTGSGKSTLLDIIMSLLPLKQGSLAIDGEVVTLKNQHLWQSRISHVPQHVFLSDTTIAENIAFGIPLKDINYDRLREAAKGAQILEVINALNDGFNAITGERGVQFSGGQRQRIGIARALYKKSDVIILDEATSALDSKTESAVMETINNMSEKMTILIIAHRLSTLKKCDQIYELDKGVITKSGTYKDIINNN